MFGWWLPTQVRLQGLLLLLLGLRRHAVRHRTRQVAVHEPRRAHWVTLHRRHCLHRRHWGWGQCLRRAPTGG